MEALAERDPDRAKTVRRRASRVVRRFVREFPRDPDTGVLNDDVDAKAEVCGRHSALTRGCWSRARGATLA